MGWNFNVGHGRKVLDAFPSLGGKVFIVTGSADAWYGILNDVIKPDPDGSVRLFTGIESAYSALTANSNDVIYYLGGGTSQTLAAKLTWGKNYCHLIGMAAPTNIAQRSRVFMTSTVTTTPMVDVTATGCSIKNVYFFHGINNAAALVDVQVTGGRNYFENVHFAGVGNATQSAAGAASLKLNAAAECKFKDCSIGLDTITRDADATEILFDGSAVRNTFEDCLIYGWTDSASYSPVTVADNTGVDRFQLFKNCNFLVESANNAVTAATAFNIPTNMVSSYFILDHCTGVGIDAWDSNTRGKVYVMDAPTPAANTAGLARKIT